MTADMTGKTVLITGATAGIGLATARALAARGAEVLMVARDQAKGEHLAAALRCETGNGLIRVLQADLSSQASLRALAAQVRREYPQLHVLINNAGGFFGARQTTLDGLEMTFAVNHLAYFLLTLLLLPTLESTPGARIVNVSSAAQGRARLNLNDLQGEQPYSGMHAYSQSKLANVLFTRELARRLKGRGVTVNALHPGVVRSNFGNGTKGMLGVLFPVLKRLTGISPESGARTSVYLATSPDVEGISGLYFDKCRAVKANPLADDEGLAQRLWTESERLTRRSAPA